MDPVTLMTWRFEQIAPHQQGDPERSWVLPEDQLFDVIDGAVADRWGNPLAGLQVRVTSWALRVEHEGRSFSHSSIGSVTLTKPDGSFTLRRVPRSGSFLAIASDRTMPLQIPIDANEASSPLSERITVPLLRRVRIETPSHAGANRVQILDREGNPLPLQRVRRDRTQTSQHAPVEHGSTEVLTVSDAATTIVLYADEEEVTRLAVTLDRDELWQFQL